MKRRLNPFTLKKTVLVAAAVSCFGIDVHAQQTGDFTAAYAYSANSQARTAVPTPSTMAGPASFGVVLPANFTLAAATQTFTATKTPGSSRSWGYGVTKVEANRSWALNASLQLAGDYTITLPTDGNEPPGIEHYAHQFLGMLQYQHSQNYFEIDAGDLLGARSAAPGYKQTALLSLIGQRDLKPEQNTTKFDFELDASPPSEGAPSSAVLTAGMEHTFKSKIKLTALASAGLTANDPAIGVTFRIGFSGNLAHKPASAEALTSPKLQRLETVRLPGRFGRF